MFFPVDMIFSLISTLLILNGAEPAINVLQKLASGKPVVVHAVVSLTDNEHQGIVPVSKRLGNGDDLDNNLNWGAAYGFRTYFSKQKGWKRIFEKKDVDEIIMERLVYQFRDKNIFLVGDAYRGKNIKNAVRDFLRFIQTADHTVAIKVNESLTVEAGSRADLVAYLGHNGLMDFFLEGSNKTRKIPCDAVIISCFSKKYFQTLIEDSACYPLIWTTNYITAESYTLHGVIEKWIEAGTKASIRTNAAKYYAKYQNVSLKSAMGLIVSGL
jgi:hypothetical protein